MPRNGTATRESILDTAQALIFDRGYGGVSIDSVIREVGITKGAFFHHFKSKAALAEALIERFDASDADLNAQTWARADRLAGDPLQRVLVFIGLFEEMFASLDEAPSCLFASYVYELQLFDEDTRKIVADAFNRWRRDMKHRLDEVAERYPPAEPVDTTSLADMFTVIIEGAFTTAKAMREPGIVAEQMGHYRKYIEMVFSKRESASQRA